MNNLFNTFPFGKGPFNVDQRGLDKAARERVLAAVCGAGYVVVGEAGDSGRELAIAADQYIIERRPLSMSASIGDNPTAYYDMATGSLVFNLIDAAEAARDDGEAHRHIRDLDPFELGGARFHGRDVEMDTRELRTAWYRDPVKVADVPASKVVADSPDTGKTMVLGDIHGDSADRTLAAIQAKGYAITSDLKTLVDSKVPFTFVSGAIIRDLTINKSV